jgi:hypothetical protein
VRAKDLSANTLTDFGVLLRTKMVFLDDQPVLAPDGYEVWDIEAEYQMIDDSVYMMNIYPELRGNYDVFVYICEKQDNECADLSEFTMISGCPLQVYLTSMFPSPFTSSAEGAITEGNVRKTEYFTVYVRDLFGNMFDALTDEIHLDTGPDKFIRVEMIGEGLQDPSDPASPIIRIETEMKLNYMNAANGTFQYKYMFLQGLFNNYLHIKVMDSEPYFNTKQAEGLSFEDLILLPYQIEAPFVEI